MLCLTKQTHINRHYMIKIRYNMPICNLGDSHD